MVEAAKTQKSGGAKIRRTKRLVVARLGDGSLCNSLRLNGVVESAIDGTDGLEVAFLVEGKIVLLAEGLQAGVDDLVVVAGHAGPQMVLNLVVKMASDDVDDKGGGNILGRGKGRSEPITLLSMTVDGEHGVVKGEDPSEVSSTDSESPEPPEAPSEVVAHEAQVAQHGEVEDQAREFKDVELTDHPQRVEEAVNVQHGGRAEERPVPDLPTNEGLVRLLKLLLIPSEERKGANIEVQFGVVGGSMVPRVPSFPPIRRAAHQDGVEQHVPEVVLLAIEEDRVVTKIVLQETSLGPAAAHNRRCKSQSRNQQKKKRPSSPG